MICKNRGPRAPGFKALALSVSLLFGASVLAKETSGRTAAANRLLENIRHYSRVPGLAAAVAIDGELVWTGTTGLADVATGRQVTVDSRFRLASVSKLYAATLALRLWEEKRLDLDTDVRHYVASWPPHDGATITLRHLASHSSGINHYRSLASSDYVEGRHYPDIFEALEFFKDYPLLNAPGEAYSYSSFGFALMNAVITTVTEKSYGEALETWVLEPAGLLETGIEDVRHLPAKSVSLYDVDDSGAITLLTPNDQSHVWGATGMRASARDVVRFGVAFFGGELVSKSTIEMALEPVELSDGGMAGIGRYHVGFGFRVGEDWDGRAVAHHAGVTPGVRSILLGYRDGGAVVALLSNARWTARIETTAELLAAPFLEDEGSSALDCPSGSWRYEGQFDDKSEIGEIRLGVEDGLCVGTVESKGALSEQWHLESSPRRRMPLVRVSYRSFGAREHVFALAYPWGLAPLRVKRVGDDFRAEGDLAGRVLSLQWTSKQE